MTPEQHQTWDEWVATRPPKIQEAARAFPPNCYRSKDNPRAHYLLHAYEEPEDDTPITVKVIHGADSFMPGFMVFGFNTDNLVPCGCGGWLPATTEQTERAGAIVDAVRIARGH